MQAIPALVVQFSTDLSADEDDEFNEEFTPQRSNHFHHKSKHRSAAKKDEEPQQQRMAPPTSAGRATRYLSICDPSLQLPAQNLLKLRQLQINNNTGGPLSPKDITDEFLDTMQFKLEIKPERRDDLDTELDSSPMGRRRRLNTRKESMTESSMIPSTLSDERRLQIIEEILKELNGRSVLDDFRRANAVPMRWPKTTQMQKNVAEHLCDLTGSDVIMLNDHLYMQKLCQRLKEKQQAKHELHFERLALAEKHRERLEHITSHYN